MNEVTARAFRNYRRENPRVPAVSAYAIVTRQTTVPAWAQEFDASMSGERWTWTGEVDGWDIEISAEVDGDADYSWLGEFTDDAEDAVPNPEYRHGRYKFFRPNPDRTSSIKDFPGMSRADALAAIREEMEADARLALEPQYVITVTASLKGVGLGSSNLCGTFIDSSNAALWTVDDHGMLDDAIRAADIALASLQIA